MMKRFWYASVLAAGVGLWATSAPGQLLHEDFGLLASDASAGDVFGVSVAASGDRGIIGAMGDDDNGDRSGSAYIFNIGTGQQVFKLLPDDGAAEHGFGRAVAIDGNLIVVGAVGDNTNDAGEVYLFDVFTGQQIVKFVAQDRADFDKFGISVSISGTTVVIGAPGDDDNGDNSGSVYLFDATTGLQVAKLNPTDSAAGDGFGAAVAISGATIVVGNRPETASIDACSAYVFDALTGLQTAKLLPTDAPVGRFGSAVAISGDRVLVGAYADSTVGDRYGAAYLFDAVTAQQISKLTAPDAAETDDFGWSVAISGNRAVIGAVGDDDNAPSSGSAYVFDVSTGEQIAKMLSSNGGRNDSLGSSVAISGDTALVGAIGGGKQAIPAGGAYLFDVSVACPADLAAPVGTLDTFDISAFLAAYNAQSFTADFAAPYGLFNFYDVAGYLSDYNAGCP